VLEAGGLGVQAPGVVRQKISFGDLATTASAAVTAVYGRPTLVTTLEECGAGPLEVTVFDGLSLAAQENKFVGWSLDGRGGQPLPSSQSGIRIGSTRRSIEKAHRIVAFESSLGTEFTADGFTGLLSGAGATARVTHLWAGATCIMR
jgi:hypothetical protein